jgi:N-acetylglucosaminyl-diphospho-decaprenol L-rhamnosyltransferase
MADADPQSRDARVDAVVVAYNSAGTLRGCVEALVPHGRVRVVVVDNASSDDSLATVEDLPIERVHAGQNLGFAAGCNLGAQQGAAAYVLFINPDARVEQHDLDALIGALDDDPDVGIVAPRILDGDGSLAYSLRRFPRLRSTFAQALFLHRVLPRAAWTDECVRSPEAYDRRWDPDWASGACLLVRRSALAAVGGFDEEYFLYCEDTDLCAAVRAAGWSVRYEPGATARHVGGASGPREELFGVLARARVRYARKHRGRIYAGIEAVGVVLGHLTHAAVALTRPAALRGHLAAIAVVVGVRAAHPEVR